MNCRRGTVREIEIKGFRIRVEEVNVLIARVFSLSTDWLEKITYTRKRNGRGKKKKKKKKKKGVS